MWPNSGHGLPRKLCKVTLEKRIDREYHHEPGPAPIWHVPRAGPGRIVNSQRTANSVFNCLSQPSGSLVQPLKLPGRIDVRALYRALLDAAFVPSSTGMRVMAARESALC
jgi:hypothetical protein